CRQLEGMPLAIELAAARVKALPVTEIAARLADMFRLLTGGSRTALPRQQTLRAAIDWSYDLLTQPEKALLRRLSVFAGGWTLEAGEAVCSDFGFRAGERSEGNRSAATQGGGSGRLDFGLPTPTKTPADRTSLSDPIQNPKSKIQNLEVLDLL